MNYFIGVLIIVYTALIFAVGGIAHEMDIITSCINKGYADHAVWLTDIKCEVMHE